MRQISLKRLVSQPEIVSLLDQFLPDIEKHICIETIEGKIVFGNLTNFVDRLPDRSSIMLAGEVIGAVVSNEKTVQIAHLLSYLAEQEQSKKSLAKEVLDKYRELNLLSSLSQHLAACFDLKEIGNLVLAETQKIINLSSASIMLLKDQELEIIASIGLESQIKTNLTAVTGIVGRILESGQAEIVNNVKNDPSFIQGYLPISSLICAPIYSKGKVIGVLNISHQEPINYMSQDLKFVIHITSLASSAIENALMHKHQIEEAKIQSQLERYVPAQLVNAIIASKGQISLAPAKRKITILFTDIRGFTTKCEELPAEQIVGYLNEYFTQMVDVIFSEEGTVNKFVGDMIVAMFGAPYQLIDAEKRAIEAAIRMQLRLKNMSNQWIKENFLTGIGISSGDVVVGNIGTPQHQDYTAIGDEVNLASRLQSIAKGGQILVSHSVYQATKEYFTFQEMGQITVKGKHKSEDVFEVIY